MKYRIGDVARIFGVTAEMIRYYEKQGAIKPRRDSDNNYRYYTTQDLFTLMEAAQMKTFGLKINEINPIKLEEYSPSMVEYLGQFRKDLIEELSRKNLLLMRIDELSERLESARYNLNKYWIKKIPACYRYILMKSHGDDYSRLQTPGDMKAVIFNPKNYGFFENMIEFQTGHEIWFNAIRTDYAGPLGIGLEGGEHLKAGYCLCTVVDMGNMGEFTRDLSEPLICYANQHNHVQDGPIRGILCSRGVEQGEYHRYLELHMPIKV